MTDFQTHLLRERFTLMDKVGKTPDIIALSNRIVLPLPPVPGQPLETFVIRAQVAHAALRLAGLMLNAYERTGPLLHRQIPLDWDDLWARAAGAHEQQFNEKLWGAVYHDGKCIFAASTHHPFFDVIEQVDAKHAKNYDDSVQVAEKLFSQAGKPITIHYDTGMAATFHIGKQSGKCGLIQRDAVKNQTFVFYGEKRDGAARPLSGASFLQTAAAFWEGIQLSFTIGQGNEKLRQNKITLYSPEEVALSSARTRLAEAQAAIKTFENTHVVTYRPDKADFAQMISKAEQKTAARLSAEAAAAEMAQETLDSQPDPL